MTVTLSVLLFAIGATVGAPMPNGYYFGGRPIDRGKPLPYVI